MTLCDGDFEASLRSGGQGQKKFEVEARRMKLPMVLPQLCRVSVVV